MSGDNHEAQKYWLPKSPRQGENILLYISNCRKVDVRWHNKYSTKERER